MNLGLAAGQQAFRSEVVSFVYDWRHVQGFFAQDRRWEQVRAFYAALGERGWLSLAWPREAGGLGRSAFDEFLLWDEIAYARVARPPLGAGIVAKTLIRYGSEDQKARWLPPIRRSEVHFSLGYSEPEAGSDLAAVRTRATLDGEHYVVRGEKVWTSYAQHSDYLWCLCRTGEQEGHSRGLTMLILDLHAEGVSISPLPTLDGEQLNAIHLADVRVPANQRIGPEDGAWRMMGAALADERHVQFPPKRLRRDLEDVVAFVSEEGLAGDPYVRRQLAELASSVLEAEMHALRVLDAMQKGRPAAVEAAANKVFQTELCQQIARTALEVGGPAALAIDRDVEFLWRQSLWETIGGGTSEVMRGVVARAGLGLGGKR